MIVENLVIVALLWERVCVFVYDLVTVGVLLECVSVSECEVVNSMSDVSPGKCGCI